MQSLFILCKASAVCDPQIQDFYKIQSKTFTFCTSPIPHLCPVCLIPKATKEMSEKSSSTLTFTFYSNPSKKINQIFGCGGSFPFDIVAQILESKTLGRVAASDSKKTKNRFQGGEGRRSVLIMRHHQVLLVYQLTHFYSYFYA